MALVTVAIADRWLLISAVVDLIIFMNLIIIQYWCTTLYGILRNQCGFLFLLEITSAHQSYLQLALTYNQLQTNHLWALGNRSSKWPPCCLSILCDTLGFSQVYFKWWVIYKCTTRHYTSIYFRSPYFLFLIVRQMYRFWGNRSFRWNKRTMWPGLEPRTLMLAASSQPVIDKWDLISNRWLAHVSFAQLSMFYIAEVELIVWIWISPIALLDELRSISKAGLTTE